MLLQNNEMLPNTMPVLYLLSTYIEQVQVQK